MVNTELEKLEKEVALLRTEMTILRRLLNWETRHLNGHDVYTVTITIPVGLSPEPEACEQTFITEDEYYLVREW